MFARDLLQIYSLVKQIMTDKSLRNFSVSVRVAVKKFTYQI